MNMKLLAVVTPPSMYHGCSTWKTLWEEKFKGVENSTLGDFTAVNIKKCGCRNVRKHREIKDSDKYINMKSSFKFISLYKMRMTSSDPKDYFVR